MRERRVIVAEPRIERRDDGGDQGSRIVGHAAVFDIWYSLYEGRYWSYREIVRPGAFRRAIREKQDVRSLFNHDMNYVLGRTASRTLTLREDETGLYSETLAPPTDTIRDLVIAPIERGDITGMSFSFAPVRSDETKEKVKDGVTTITTKGERITIRYEGEKRIEERELLDLDLYDVGPVTFPAYDTTDVGVRSAYCPSLEARAREMDRPHRRHAPRREELARWLSGSRDPATPTSSAVRPERVGS